jgi:ribosome-associated heat shock protein Hsp15
MADHPPHKQPGCAGVRLDRWLWAARFFKTRSLAKAAIEGGRVLIIPAGTAERLAGQPEGRGVKPKPSREIEPGDRLSIRRSETTQTVVVRAVDERRGSATVASGLFEETPESIEARETARARRQMDRAGLLVPAARPDKRDRRERLRLKLGDADGDAFDVDAPAEASDTTGSGEARP